VPGFAILTNNGGNEYESSTQLFAFRLQIARLPMVIPERRGAELQTSPNFSESPMDRV